MDGRINVAEAPETMVSRRPPNPVEKANPAWTPRPNSPLENTPHKAGIIRDGLMSAFGALIAMSAQSGSAAARDGVQHFDMRPVQPAPALFNEAGAAGANDVSHLDGWLFHFLARFTLPRREEEHETGSSSSGLATAPRCLRDRCR